VSLKNKNQTSTQAGFDVQAQFRRALGLHQQGMLAEAERIYAEILQRVPNHFGALNLLGVIACQNRAYERAVDLISKAISINPNAPAAHSNLGVALRELRCPEEALASFEKAIALKPDYAEAHHNRGLALRELGRPEEAIASYENAIALKPDCETFYNRGNTFAELKRFEEALDSYDRAIALHQNYADAYSNRGNALKEIGRFEEALASYDRVIALRPDSADYFNRGLALYKLGRSQEALASFDKAVALRPDYAEAHYNRGIALKDLSRVREAIISYDRAIESNLDFAEAYSNRGLALEELGFLEEALANCDKAISLKPDLAEAYANRGLVLFELGRIEDSLAACDEAITRKPDMVNAHNNAGSVLNALGRLGEARAAFLKALDIDPRNAAAYFNLAHSKKFAPGDPYLDAMEKLATEAGRLSKIDRVNLDFALGNAYADLKDPCRSFERLLTANAGKRATISYDEQGTLALFGAIETTFSGELIAAKSGGGDPSTRAIFILGMPRSGTTLVEQILASHPMVYGAGELEDLNQIAREPRNVRGLSLQYPYFVPPLDRSELRNIGEQYLAAIGRRAPTAEHITDKMPSNFLFVGLIYLALPNAKIIHTMRDPVDTCVSCFSKLFAHGQEFTYELGELGRYYKRYERLMAHWRSVLPAGRILDVRYEDVVADLETQARRILAYCELPWDDRCLSFHKTERPVRTASVMQVRQPIYKSAVGRWRDYEEFLGPLLEALGVSPASTDR
jgi:tetratricopeptide (TPR) repeat protein